VLLYPGISHGSGRDEGHLGAMCGGALLLGDRRQNPGLCVSPSRFVRTNAFGNL